MPGVGFKNGGPVKEPVRRYRLSDDSPGCLLQSLYGLGDIINFCFGIR